MWNGSLSADGAAAKAILLLPPTLCASDGKSDPSKEVLWPGSAPAATGAASPFTAVAGRSGNMLLASAPGPPVSEAKRGEGFCDMGRRGESLSSCRNDERLNVVSNAPKPSPAMSAAAVRGRRREDLGGDGTRMWS